MVKHPLSLTERWRQARTIRNRRELIELALALGNADAAARALGISRRHFTRLKKALQLPDASSSERTPGHGETSGLTEDPTTRIHVVHHGTPSPTGPLTSWPTVPSFRGAIAFAGGRREEMAKITLDLPSEDKEWLEDEAMKDKRRQGLSRPSMSRVIHRLINEERERSSRAATKENGE